MTRAIGVCFRVERLLVDREADAWREDADPADRFFVLRPALAELRLACFERVEEALRDRPDAPRDDADFALLDGLRFVLLLLALRDADFLPDFPRDFLALVAIGALLGVSGMQNHLDDSKNQAHP